MSSYIDAEKAEKDGWLASRIYQYDAKTNVYETKKMTGFPTVDEGKIATEYCMKHFLVMVSMDTYEKLIAYYNRGNGLGE